ncbi:hypothetical protein TNCV_3883701 [Trichonephila clavipes]|nr:hypothetical protein TNCV_3883701 [Trichonephila clavipes]
MQGDKDKKKEHAGDDSQIARIADKLSPIWTNNIKLWFVQAETLWLQRLPSEMQSILSFSSETLENLAKLADKIAEVRNDPLLNVSAIAKSTSSNAALRTNLREDLSNPLYQEVVALRQQVDALRQQVDALRQQVDAHRHQVDTFRQQVDALRQQVDALNQ